MRMDEKLFVKRMETETLNDDCFSAGACVDCCATNSAVDFWIAKDVVKRTCICLRFNIARVAVDFCLILSHFLLTMSFDANSFDSCADVCCFVLSKTKESSHS